MQSIGNAKQGFQCIAQCSTCEPLDESFARSIPLRRKDILHLLHRKQRTIPHAYEHLLTLWRWYADIFDMNMQQRSLLRIMSPQELIGIQCVIYQLFEDIDIPFVGGSSGRTVETF